MAEVTAQSQSARTVCKHAPLASCSNTPQEVGRQQSGGVVWRACWALCCRVPARLADAVSCCRRCVALFVLSWPLLCIRGYDQALVRL